MLLTGGGGAAVPVHGLALLQNPPSQEKMILQNPPPAGQTAYLPAACLNTGPCLCQVAKGPLCSSGQPSNLPSLQAGRQGRAGSEEGCAQAPQPLTRSLQQ